MSANHSGVCISIKLIYFYNEVLFRSFQPVLLAAFVELRRHAQSVVSGIVNVSTH